MELSRPLNVYLVPYFGLGHLIPLVHLSRLLAWRGQHVTIVTTPSNAKIFHETLEKDRARGQHIRIHTVRFPSDEVGLPVGLENSLASSDGETTMKIYMASRLIQAEVEAFMELSPPDVLISDIVLTWTEATAKRLGIPRFIFNTMCIFDACVVHAIKTHPEAFASDSGPPYHVPSLPHPLTLPVKPSPQFARATESLFEAEKGGYYEGVIVNSFADLEVGYTEYYENLTGCKVWHIGPLSLFVKNTLPELAAVSGGSDAKHECLRWLSSKEPNSVVYVCFGSVCRFSAEQLLQIAAGIDSSGHQFLWVVHGKNDNKWLPDGFHEKERGMIVINEWVPQPQILNHPATGCFLTHCGWNSVVEAISAGVPMITMPCFVDQFLNEKLVTEVNKFGVQVGGALEWSVSPHNSTKKNLVSGERIEKAIKSVMAMDELECSRNIRREAKEVKEKAWNAVHVGGSSYNTLTAFLDHLRTLKPKRASNDM